MATETEKQDFLDTVAAGHLQKFLEYAISNEAFVNGFREKMGVDGLSPDENRGLPVGETPFPTDDSILSVGGFNVKASQLHEAFLLEEANNIQIRADQIAFIQNLLSGGS